jgi:pentose-5-phosphate-3-epimerase
MSGKRKTSLVLADVDGTLVTSAGRARDAVNALQRAGIDVVLVMRVNPVFGGQAFLPETLPKIRRLRTICAARRRHPVIEVDGGENVATVERAAAAGATAIVAGSAIFGTRDYAAAITAIRASAAAAATNWP